MSTRHIDIRVFAEGVRIPASAVSRTQSRVGSMKFTVSLPPTPVGFSVLPGTLIHVFVKRNEPTTSGQEKERFVLFAEGRVRGRSAAIDRSGNRSLMIECEGLDSEWQYIPIGFDVGMDTTFPRPRLKALFNGLSPSLYEQSYLPRLDQVMTYQVFRILSGGRDMATDPFFDLKSVMYNMVSKQGPALGFAQMISLLPRIHPLERQKMQATRFYKRLVAIENKGFTKHLLEKDNFEKLKGRIDAMNPVRTTLRQVIDEVLPATYHHQFSIASPFFNEDLYANRASTLSAPIPEPEEVVDIELPKIEVEPPDVRQALVTSYNHWPSDIYSIEDFAQGNPGDDDYAPVPEKYWDNVRYLAANLHIISSWLGGVKLKISPRGGYRTKEGNAAVNGASGSYHTSAMAVDFMPPRGVSQAEVWMLVDKLIANNKITRGGLGWYPVKGHIHYDIRGSRAYWSEAGEFNRKEIEMAALGSKYLDDSYQPSPNTSLSSQMLDEEWQASTQAGVLPSFVIKPNMQFSPPPLSNVFFGEQVSGVQAGEGFDNAPTRMMMLAPSVVQKFIEPGNPWSAMFTPMYFAPNHLQGIVDKFVSDPRYSDIRVRGYDTELDVSVEADAAQEALGDADLSFLDPDLKDPFLAHSAITSAQKTDEEKDVVSKIINDSSSFELPERLMSIYTFEELFRGVRGMQTRLPYMQKSTDPEEWVAIYGHYAFAMMSRQARIMRMNMPLNLNVAVGFSGAFYDHSVGWILGEVETVQDTIDASGQAFTMVQMGGCAFYSDLDNPYWARMYDDSQGAFDNYSRPGQQTPTLFDAAFAPGSIGNTIYKGVLGVGSVIDLAQHLSNTDGMTLRDALDFLRERYESEKNPTLWAAGQFRRPIVTEGEFMQYVLEASPESPSEEPVKDQLHDRYGGTYPVHDWPNQAQFVAERRYWAEDYKRDLRVRDSAIDVIRPNTDNYDVKEEEPPNKEASKHYESLKSKRTNVQPTNDFLGT